MNDEQTPEIEPAEVAEGTVSGGQDELTEKELGQVSGGMTPSAPSPVPIPYPNLNKL